MGNCSNNAQQSTLKMENPISSNSNTFFHVEWSLDGGNSWETPHVAEVQPGGEAFKTVSVPNGQTIRWRYHPHTQVATPTGVTYTPLTESPIADCTYDTIENVGLGDCDTSGEAVSSYVLTNNTSITLVYKVQYKIQGQSGFTTVDDDYELTAGQVSPTPFTQSVPSGKYIEWRYAVGTNASLAATAPQKHLYKLNKLTVILLIQVLISPKVHVGMEVKMRIFMQRMVQQQLHPCTSGLG